MSEADKVEGGAAKRHKTNDDDDKEGLLRRIEELTARNGELTARNEELTARVEELAARVDELESENKGLRCEESHGDSLLPVVTNASIDLSRVDPSLVAYVASFLCLSRELLNLALTCKSFGWRPSSSTTLGLSLIEEAARQLVTTQLQPSDVERNALPPCDGTTAWLPILHELERLRLPLEFSRLVGRGIAHAGRDSAVAKYGEGYECCTAFASYVMKRGVHYASFNLINVGNYVIVGVTRPFHNFDFVNEDEDFDMYTERHFGNLLAQRTAAWVGNMHYCQFHCDSGEVNWTDLLEYRDGEDEIDWDGHEVFGDGDVAGLLVDLNEGTLSVYKNGRKLVVAKDGLAGEYCFFAKLYAGGEISLERGTPPQPP